MLKPKNKTVLESTIKELPTRSTQVNSTTRMPHIRNQHVNDKDLSKHSNSSASEEIDDFDMSDIGIPIKPKNPHKGKKPSTPDIGLDSSVPIEHTLPNGKKVKLNLTVMTEYDQSASQFNAMEEGPDKDAIRRLNSKDIDRASLGYINNESGNIDPDFYGHEQGTKLSKDFFKDFGVDEFMQSLNFGEGAEFNLSFNTKASSEGDSFMFTLQFVREHDPAAIDADIERIQNKSFVKKEGMLFMSMKADKERNSLNTFLDLIRASGPDITREIGTKTQANIMKNSKLQAQRQGIDNVHVGLDAGLTTGPYLWPECGYLVDESNRSAYLFHIKERAANINKDYPMYSTEHYEAMQEMPEIQDLNQKFMETGDVQHIKKRMAVEHRETPGIKNDYPDVNEYYKDHLKDMCFPAHFDFSVDDTPRTNVHLSKLNDRHLKAFNKPLSI